MATQAQLVETAAAQLVEDAKIIGQRCGLPKGTEAATVLEHAYAMAIADMVGPGFVPDRVRYAITKMAQKLAEEIPVYQVARHSAFAKPTFTLRKPD